MKTLLEQLPSEKLAILTEAQSKYPSSVSALLKSLESNQLWIYLTYNDVIMLASYLGMHSYDPATISSIFENEQ